MPRLYRYVHVSDDGMAPCTDGGKLTLATCKPVVRRVARPGDWVMGFYPKPAPPGLVSWAGCVSGKLEPTEYERRFRGRADAAYRADPDGGIIRLRPSYHPAPQDQRKDLSAPVLLFADELTWYFGDDPRMLPESLSHLAASGQGHRVNGVTPDDAVNLLRWLRRMARPGMHGRPRESGSCTDCGRAGKGASPPRC